MLPSQKLSLRLSKVRQELADLPDDAEDSAADALTDQYVKLETEYRSALVAEAEDQRQAEEAGEVPPPQTSEDQELTALILGASIRDYLQEATSGNPLTGGQSLELRQALMGESGNEGMMPLAMMTSGYNADGTPMEYRLGSDAVTTVAEATGTQPRPIAQAIFQRSDGGYLGVQYPTVPVGQTSYPAITASATAVSIFTNFDHLNREMFTVFDRDVHGH